MKTAISLPDDTFARATQRAIDLGISRSEFFARAAQRYLDHLDARSLVHSIDDAVQRSGGSDESATMAVVAGHRALTGIDDVW